MKNQLALNVINDNVVLIDNSQRTTFENCPRLWYYTYGLRLKPNEERGALHYGRAIHLALAAFYDPSIPQKDKHAACVEVVKNYYEKNPAPEGDWRTCERCVDSIGRYFITYGLFDNIQPIIINQKEPLIEVPFAVHLFNYTFAGPILVRHTETNELETKPDGYTIKLYYTGRIDMVALFAEKTPVIVDHKTSSIGGATLFTEYTNSNQFKGYIYAIQKTTALHPTKALINVLVERKSGTGELLRSPLISFTEEQIKEFETDLFTTCQNLLESFETNELPMFTNSCRTKWNTACSFLDVCCLPPSQRHLMLDTTLFAHDDWSPLNEEETFKPRELKTDDSTFRYLPVGE